MLKSHFLLPLTSFEHFIARILLKEAYAGVSSHELLAYCFTPCIKTIQEILLLACAFLNTRPVKCGQRSAIDLCCHETVAGSVL
jgi:hypothetical protein